MLTYCQSTGVLTNDEGGGVHPMGIGYSGNGPGLNNGEMEADHDVGPIPVGRWRIGPPLDPIDHLGPLAMPLTPEEGTDTLGRSGFFMHGDNAAMNHTASHGCIIMGHTIREAVNNGSDRDLEVVD